MRKVREDDGKMMENRYGPGGLEDGVGGGGRGDVLGDQGWLNAKDGRVEGNLRWPGDGTIEMRGTRADCRKVAELTGMANCGEAR